MIKQIKNILSPYSDIAFAFIFGSFSEGNVTAHSDIDIAVFFCTPADFYRINDLRETLSKELKIETDIVNLNNASPIIRMQVLKKGILLLKNNTHAYNDFFVKTVKEYDDLKRTRKEIEDNILRGKIYA